VTNMRIFLDRHFPLAPTVGPLVLVRAIDSAVARAMQPVREGVILGVRAALS